MPVNPFVVHVARLQRDPGARWHEERQGQIESEQGRSADSKVPLDAVVDCDVVLESFDGGIMATGTVRAPWVGVCCRCAVPVAGELSVRVRERFAQPLPVPAHAGGGRDRSLGELAAGDEEAYPILDDELDLSTMARDALMLELPLAPLCRPDCRGLCPQCGTDRNEGECACVAPRDPRWANLDVLRSPPSGGRPPEHAREGS